MCFTIIIPYFRRFFAAMMRNCRALLSAPEADPIDDRVEAFGSGKDFDCNAQVEAFYRRRLEAREADGVLLRRDERIRPHVGRAVEGVENLGRRIAVMVGVSLAPNDLRAKPPEGVLESARRCNA